MTVDRQGGGVTLRVEGKLAGESVGVLGQECRRHADRGRTVSLALEGVTFVDDAGVALLFELGREGVVVTGSSAFVRARLEGEEEP